MSLHVLADPEALAAAVAARWRALAEEAIAERGSFRVALCGGGTPRRLYELLGSEAWRERLDGSRWEVYWGDERCVPADHEESNYRLARESFLDALEVPEASIHRIRGELEPEEAARDYEARLAARSVRLDGVLLGLGEDGHTASIFPESSWDEDPRLVVAVNASYEDRPAWRVTLTPAAFGEARRLLFLVSGAGKHEALRGSLGRRDVERWPAHWIRPRRGSVEWWVDEAAWKGAPPVS